MVSISAVIIAYNEEKNIGRCIASLTGIADDIVVVDSFSKDRTREICESMGARVVLHAFKSHIDQKNHAITQALHPHILSLDADEALSPQLAKSILEVKKNWTHDGYSMNRLTNYCGQWIHHCGWYPDRKLRLWDSRKGQWGGVNPHDVFIMEKGCRTKRLDGDLLHYSFYSIEQHKQKVEQYSSIAASELKARNKKASRMLPYVKWLAAFVKSFIIRTGFLDGYHGWVICLLSARTSYLKYHKLHRLYEND
jgi:glycosyltransferase involved in cell wall biosynthesis